MWRYIEIINYRSIEKVSLYLAPFTVVVGPNGSGKSNFADALVFARDVATDAALAVDRRGGIAAIRRWRPTKPTDITIDVCAAVSQEALIQSTDYVRHKFTIHSGREGAWTFKHESIQNVSGSKLTFELVRKANKLDIRPQWPLTRPGLVATPNRTLSETASAMVLARQLGPLSRNVALRNVRRIRLAPEVMRLPQQATEMTRLDESGNNIAVAYRNLAQSSQEQILTAMRKIVPGLVSIRVEPFDRFLMLKFEQKQTGGEQAIFSAAEMSEGALRALGILVAAQQMTRDELLIIEEPEVSIHIGAAQLLFEVLKEASRHGAVLLTTHSADLLDAARDEQILVCSYRDGITRVGRLAAEQRQVVKEGLFSVAELMRSEPLRIEGDPPAALRT